MGSAENGFAKSLWVTTAEPAVDSSALTGRIDADAVVVGAGYTGLSAALHLAEMGRSVAVLEAREIAWGASGRNGAHVNPGWKILPSGIRAMYGKDRGGRVVRSIGGACDLVFDLISRHAIECAPRRAPYLRGAYGKSGIREVENWVREWGEIGAPVALKNAAETHELMGSTFFHGGMEDARGGSLQPLSYAYGLARAAMKAGARLYARSPASVVARDGSGWSVTTAGGAKVRAQYLLLATNGYTDGLWRGLRRQIVPVASLQSATAPLAEEIRRTILPGGHHVSDTRNSMVYFRVDETGRFQIGGRGSPFDPCRQDGDTRHLRAEAVRIFPVLKDAQWEFDWGGLVAISKSYTPSLIELGPNAYAGLGFCGRGVAMGTMMGKQMAELAMGEDVPMPRVKMAPFVFHRFRNAGVAWHMISGRFLDRLNGRHSRVNAKARL